MYYNFNSQQYPSYLQQNYYTPDRNSRQGQVNYHQQFSTFSHDRPVANRTVRDNINGLDSGTRFYQQSQYNPEMMERHIDFHKPLAREPQEPNMHRISPKQDKPQSRNTTYNPNSRQQKQNSTIQKHETQNSVAYFPMKQSFVQLHVNSPLKHQKYEAQTKNQYLYSPAPQVRKDTSVSQFSTFNPDSPNRVQYPPQLDLNSPTKPHQRSLSSKNFVPQNNSILRQSQQIQTPKENLKLSFVAKSRPGENHRVAKTNQDSFSIQSNFCGHEQAYLFMVLDGHGQNGHFVSDWVLCYYESLKLHKQLLTLFENHFSLFINQHFDDSVISKAFHTCFTQVDTLLSQTGMDVSQSGSTIVVVIIIENKMWCGNLGDSRAILMSLKQKQLLIYELSHDHKPDNPLEEQRIKKAGGRVSPVRNHQGQGLGPMRVWAQNYQYPGLAMSRSMGDQLAHQVGVISTPEIIGHTITSHDKYLVLGSDGLFEWLSNQHVAKMILDSIEKGQTPQQAVDQLVQKATQEWLKLGDSVDDITCILVLLPQ